MIGSADLIFGVLLPALIAAVIFAAAVFLTGPAPAIGDTAAKPPLRWRAIAALLPLGAGVACAAGVAGLVRSLPGFPPVEGRTWLFYLALAAGLLEAVLILTAAPRWVGIVTVCGVAACCFRGALHFKFNSDDPDSWSTAQGLAYVGSMAILAAAAWAALSHAAKHTPLLAPTVAWGAAALAAVVLAATGDIGLGQRCGIISVIAFVELLIKIVARRRLGPLLQFTAAAVPGLGVSLMMILGRYLAETPVGYELVFAATPLLLFAALLLPLRPLRPWQQFILRAAVIAIPLMVAAGTAAVEAKLHENDINSDVSQ
jgi:hypothetical protein